MHANFPLRHLCINLLPNLYLRKGYIGGILYSLLVIVFECQRIGDNLLSAKVNAVFRKYKNDTRQVA